MRYALWYSGGAGTEPLWYVCLDADTREECEAFIAQRTTSFSNFTIEDTEIKRDDCPYCKAKASMVVDGVNQTVTCLKCGVVELPDHADHLQDADCTVNADTLSCVVCGVDHSSPCHECTGRGFHVPTCPQYSL